MNRVANKPAKLIDKGTKPLDWREGRRIRAWELHQQGWKQVRIAQALGVNQSSVSKWLRKGREEGGVEALRGTPAPGATPKLTQEQLQRLPTLLQQGAPAYGFWGEVWTKERICRVIEREFGVTYHPAHVQRILVKLGWSRQTPALKAAQQDEAQVSQWKEEGWREVKKRV